MSSNPNKIMIDTPCIVAGTALALCRVAKIAGISEADLRIVVELAIEDAKNLQPYNGSGVPN